MCKSQESKEDMMFFGKYKYFTFFFNVSGQPVPSPGDLRDPEIEPESPALQAESPMEEGASI